MLRRDLPRGRGRRSGPRRGSGAAAPAARRPGRARPAPRRRVAARGGRAACSPGRARRAPPEGSGASRPRRPGAGGATGPFAFPVAGDDGARGRPATSASLRFVGQHARTYLALRGAGRGARRRRPAREPRAAPLPPAARGVPDPRAPGPAVPAAADRDAAAGAPRARSRAGSTELAPARARGRAVRRRQPSR